MKHLFTTLLLLTLTTFLEAKVTVGLDRLANGEVDHLLKGKKVGLITNHTAIDTHGKSAQQIIKETSKDKGYQLIALFAPEHGLKGLSNAGQSVRDSTDSDGIPIYSLHGKTRRPTETMLAGIDTLIYDIQDIGSRSYTYISTLFYVMEEAAKHNIQVIVLDRPNPLNGVTIDGPVLKEPWRSFVGYIDVPYCHGMTIGELAYYFNGEYKVGCQLKVVPMRGWDRHMTFEKTGLLWVPTSPNIPEASSPWFYPTTGILGELSIVSIGIGYTLPFKIIGAPWINADELAKKLNEQKFPGVNFSPFHFQPFFGKFAKEECQGVMITITDTEKYLPVTTQYLLMGLLKSMYREQFNKALVNLKKKRDMFNRVNGTDEVILLLENEPYPTWKLKNLHKKEKESFIHKRIPYLITEYGKS